MSKWNSLISSLTERRIYSLFLHQLTITQDIEIMPYIISYSALHCTALYYPEVGCLRLTIPAVVQKGQDRTEGKGPARAPRNL